MYRNASTAPDTGWRGWPSGIRRRLAFLVGLPLLSLMLLMAAACQPGALEPPRAATATAQAALTPTQTPTPLVSSAPTATPGGAPGLSGDSDVVVDKPADDLTLWISGAGDDDLAALEAGLGDFTAATGIQVKVVEVASQLLPELMQSAVISETLPDLILHPIELTHGWIEQGILDPAAASAVVESLGVETFEPDALAQLTTGAGEIAAVPDTGWQQVVLYRTDWFEDLGLPAPDTFEALAAAAEAIHEEDSPISGLIAPTDSSLVSTQQVFEHIAIANGCRLVSQEGEIALLHPACLEALEYYRSLINAYSPIGLQTDISARNGYLSGRTGIIITSPSVLPIIAGLSEDARPSCPECSTAEYLSMNTGIVTQLQGSGEGARPSRFGAISALGITSAANTEAAMALARYWFESLYPQWITVNPEQKVPMRRGRTEDGSQYLMQWAEAPLAPGGPTLAEVYGPEAATSLSEGIASAERWGLSSGQGQLTTTIYEELLFAPLLQDMLSGYFSSSETIVEMYLLAVDAVPGYAYPVQVAPTPTP